MLHTEPLVDNAVQTLRLNLAGRIAAVAAELPDIPLAAPAPDDILTFGGDTQAILRYPAIEVADPDGYIEDFSLAQIHGDATVRLAVVGWYDSVSLPAGSSFATFQRALRRYNRAIIDTLTQPRAFGGGVIVEMIEWSYRTNPETGERQEWTAGAFNRFRLGVSEMRSIG